MWTPGNAVCGSKEFLDRGQREWVGTENPNLPMANLVLQQQGAKSECSENLGLYLYLRIAAPIGHLGLLMQNINISAPPGRTPVSAGLREPTLSWGT